MSYELQIAAEAKKSVEALAARVALIEELLGDDLKEAQAKQEEAKAAAAIAAQPIELTEGEKQAILAARLQVMHQVANKVSTSEVPPAS